MWSLAKVSTLQAATINVIFFCMALSLILLFTRNYISAHLYFVPAGLLVVNNVFYYNASIITSEMLVIAEVVLLLLVLGRYVERPRISGVVLLGLLSCAIGLTRYFGAIWVIPTTVLCLFLVYQPLLTRLRHICVYALVTAPGILLWLLHVYGTTGHLTGLDRAQQRDLPESVAFLAQFTDFYHNVLFTLRTANFDLFSPGQIGEKAPVLFSGLSAFERGTAVIVCVVFGGVLVQVGLVLVRRLRLDALRPRHLPGMFAVSHIVLTIIVWSLGNNDPIYTRFIFPFYPLLVLAAFVAFVDADRGSLSGRIVRNSLMLFAFIYLGSQFLELSGILSDRLA